MKMSGNPTATVMKLKVRPPHTGRANHQFARRERRGTTPRAARRNTEVLNRYAPQTPRDGLDLFDCVEIGLDGSAQGRGRGLEDAVGHGT